MTGTVPKGCRVHDESENEEINQNIFEKDERKIEPVI